LRRYSCLHLGWRDGDDGLERRADIRRARARDEIAGNSLGEHAAAMQDYEIIAGLDLVDQVRCPQNADIFLGDELPHISDDALARIHIEPDGRLVEEQ
jgi:hypothetical protein